MFATRHLIVFVFTFLVLLGGTFYWTQYYARGINSISDSEQQMRTRKAGDGCRRVYLDMGTNIGVQIRKVYQPDLYPDAPVLPVFLEAFGINRSDVCSFGWEANPAHSAYLRTLESSYRAAGWPVTIFNDTAVSNRDTVLDFFVDKAASRDMEWGSRLGSPIGPGTSTVKVKVVDVVHWIEKEIFDREMPPGAQAPLIVMKTDIEGHDTTVLASLLLRGTLCKIDVIYGEHLSSDFLSALRLMQAFDKPHCPTKLIEMDDESYHNVLRPLPSRNNTQ